MSDGIDNLLATAAALSEADRHAFLAALPVETRNELELLLDADRAVQQGNLLQPIADAEPDTAIGEEGSPELPDQIGRYKILQEIGRGGMGLVYMAEQTEPVKRRVALKVIKAGMDSREVIARFEAERQALAMMDHPHIAKVLDAGMTDDRRPYFVMELVRGIPITRYCDENRLTPDERLEIFVKVCRAIQHAHQKGIIHRDIKPTNVLVGLADGEPFPKVIDFGLAKALQSKSLTDKTLFTQFGQVVGTLEYMSPEQAEMDINDVDTRTDVYSLGVLLYELLTGSTPIGRERVREAGIQRVFKLIQEEDAQLPSSRLSDSGDAITGISEQRRTNPKRLGAILKGDLDWIAVKALDKDRKRRYETASELAADITRYLSDEAIEARPPSISYRLQKVWSKHRGKVIVGGLLLGSLVAGLVGTGTMWFRASAAEITANEEADTAKRERKRANDNEQDAKQQAARADHEAEEARDAEAAATLQLAIARWDQGRVAEACHLLEEIPVQYRNTVEWHYWRPRVLGSDLTFFGAHRDVAFNSDGTRLLTAGRYARLWDATSGQLLRTYDDQGIVMSVAFSADGTQVALGGDRQDIRLFSTESGEELGTFKGHTIAPHHIEFSPDGSRVLSSEPDGKSRLWDTRSFTEELVLDSRSSTFSPDGSLIAAGFADSTIRFWDVESRQEIDAKKIQTPAVNRIAFSPDGRQIAGAFHDGILVMHVDSGKEIHRLEGYAFAFSRDGGRITSASRDRTVKVWELTNGQETMSFKGHTETVNRVRFSPDGQRIASAGLDGTCKVWDAVNGQNSRTI
ncbi:MAG: protein kinase, partial [Planctomycetaceae bacterium]